MKYLFLKPLRFLYILFSLVTLCAAEEVVKLTPFSLVERFDSFMPSFGPYASIDKVIVAEHWSGAIRIVCNRPDYGNDEQRYFAVVLYRVAQSGATASNKTTVRILSWSKQQKMPQPNDLTGDEAIAMLRKINASEFFSLAQNFDDRGLEPSPIGEWFVFAEEFRDGRALRLLRIMERSVPARALLDAIGINLSASPPKAIPRK